MNQTKETPTIKGFLSLVKKNLLNLVTKLPFIKFIIDSLTYKQKFLEVSEVLKLYCHRRNFTCYSYGDPNSFANKLAHKTSGPDIAEAVDKERTGWVSFGQSAKRILDKYGIDYRQYDENGNQIHEINGYLEEKQ